jgi:glycosyltransferase involved in cell wall biosynthesis
VRIGLVVQPLERTPPVGYGSVERTVANLAEELVARGHEVTLFASGDSQTSARLVPAVGRAILHDLDYDGLAWWPNNIQIAQVVEMQEELDVVNSHSWYGFLPALHALDVVTVTHWHGRTDRAITRSVLHRYGFAPLVASSTHQRRETEDLGLNWIATVYSGIPSNKAPFSEEGDDYLVFLGRIAPVKRPDIAIRVAREARLGVKLIGKVLPEDRAYFESAVKPQLDIPGVEFLGEMDDVQKFPILSRALGLIHPAEWEACSLSLLESLACGTPVVCLDRGGNAEVVVNGEQGFVCASFGEMPEACARLREISRQACRERFLAEFTIERMADRYVAVLERAIEEQPPPREAARRARAPAGRSDGSRLGRTPTG